MDPSFLPVSPLERLRDIQDITGVPWWPPAPGWWLLGLATLLLIWGLWRWRTLIALRIPLPGLTLGSWRWDAATALRELARRARTGEDAKTLAGELSELLRRIAMARCGRRACAGLTGSDWLDWLSAEDPADYPWHLHGRLLLEAPYAPPNQETKTELQDLILAAYAWVVPSRGRSARSSSGMGERKLSHV